jgi:hypothetical protein
LSELEIVNPGKIAKNFVETHISSQIEYGEFTKMASENSEWLKILLPASLISYLDENCESRILRWTEPQRRAGVEPTPKLGSTAWWFDGTS